MTSRLYKQALSLLSTSRRRAVRRAEGWLGREKGPTCAPFAGRAVVENIQNEAHLSGDGAFGNGAILSTFLDTWAEKHSKCPTSLARQRAYLSVCGKYILQGSKVPTSALPAYLYRYVTSESLILTLAERILGKVARDSLNRKLLSPEDALSLIEKKWKPELMTSREKVAREAPVFASLDLGVPLNRNDANEVGEALALPSVRYKTAKILLELKYDNSSVKNHRIPTVADARLYDVFRPAEERKPRPTEPATCVGWTQPLGNQAAQPEIVHDNSDISILVVAPRFVGRLR